MIATDRLIIKLWTEDLAQEFFELTQDPGFTLFPITDYRQASVDDAREWIRKNTCKYAVIEKATGKVIGMGGLTPWNYQGESLIDITYRLGSAAQGKGYGTELARALVNYGFSEMGLEQITATITPDNIPSKVLAEKLGLKFDKKIVLLGVETDLYRLYKQARS
ncbi:GNAT family N-acetyltransferase [Bdellovibrio sp. NC01]|uniref:GNAT family N-acetyltransferase n=1 Tax=Bdellovibrio sp. NC01 TaxID=2220073 RepID=UPI001157C982|nr:GNAT family N-acetyltransferase [Bdellovibrio sp. NC01]QDK36865.1 hypothetical protein DOE51_04300 [Bdellovibrio sp. NC01]